MKIQISVGIENAAIATVTTRTATTTIIAAAAGIYSVIYSSLQFTKYFLIYHVIWLS